MFRLRLRYIANPLAEDATSAAVTDTASTPPIPLLSEEKFTIFPH
jgi:hypothetical protein